METKLGAESCGNSTRGWTVWECLARMLWRIRTDGYVCYRTFRRGIASYRVGTSSMYRYEM
jgi:hypothetical protein